MNNNSIDIRDENDLSLAIGNADLILNKSYLSNLSSAHIKLNDLPFSEGDTTEALNATKLEKKLRIKYM